MHIETQGSVRESICSIIVMAEILSIQETESIRVSYMNL